MKQIAAIVLAAGSSRRFGSSNKLLAKLEGKPVLDHVLSALSNLPLCQTTTLVSDPRVGDLCHDRGINWLMMANANLGMGASLAAGASTINTIADGVMIVLGDMPFIKEETYRALLSAFSGAPKGSIVAPGFDGARGHPVIFDAAYLSILESLNDDQGAKAIIDANPEKMISVPVDDPGISKDVDHPDDLS